MSTPFGEDVQIKSRRMTWWNTTDSEYAHSSFYLHPFPTASLSPPSPRALWRFVLVDSECSSATHIVRELCVDANVVKADKVVKFLLTVAMRLGTRSIEIQISLV